MPKVEIGRQGDLERALRKLKKKLEQEGVLRSVRERKHYEKPSERKRRKQKSSQKRKK